jgi:hypothetical protein
MEGSHNQEPIEHGRRPPPGSPRASSSVEFVQEAGQRCGKDLGERWRVAGEGGRGRDGGTVPAARSIGERMRRPSGGRLRIQQSGELF